MFAVHKDYEAPFGEMEARVNDAVGAAIARSADDDVEVSLKWVNPALLHLSVLLPEDHKLSRECAVNPEKWSQFMLGKGRRLILETPEAQAFLAANETHPRSLEGGRTLFERCVVLAAHWQRVERKSRALLVALHDIRENLSPEEEKAFEIIVEMGQGIDPPLPIRDTLYEHYDLHGYAARNRLNTRIELLCEADDWINAPGFKAHFAEFNSHPRLIDYEAGTYPIVSPHTGRLETVMLTYAYVRGTFHLPEETRAAAMSTLDGRRRFSAISPVPRFYYERKEGLEELRRSFPKLMEAQPAETIPTESGALEAGLSRDYREYLSGERLARYEHGMSVLIDADIERFEASIHEVAERFAGNPSAMANWINDASRAHKKADDRNRPWPETNDAVELASTYATTHFAQLTLAALIPADQYLPSKVRKLCEALLKRFSTTPADCEDLPLRHAAEEAAVALSGALADAALGNATASADCEVVTPAPRAPEPEAPAPEEAPPCSYDEVLASMDEATFQEFFEAVSALAEEVHHLRPDEVFFSSEARQREAIAIGRDYGSAAVTLVTNIHNGAASPAAPRSFADSKSIALKRLSGKLGLPSLAAEIIQCEHYLLGAMCTGEIEHARIGHHRLETFKTEMERSVAHTSPFDNDHRERLAVYRALRGLSGVFNRAALSAWQRREGE